MAKVVLIYITPKLVLQLINKLLIVWILSGVQFF